MTESHPPTSGDNYTSPPEIRIIVADFINSLPQNRYDPARTIGSGKDALVYPLDADGEYVIKLPQPYNSRSRQQEYVRNQADIWRDAPRHDHLERPVAVLSDEDAVVYEKAPGKSTRELTGAEAEAIREEDVTSLLEVAVWAKDHGVYFDPTPKNLLYDPVAGFTVIDYQLTDNTVDTVESLADLVNVSGANFYNITEGATEYPQERCEAAIFMLEKLLSIARRQYAGHPSYPGLEHTALQRIRANQEAIAATQHHAERKLGRRALAKFWRK